MYRTIFLFILLCLPMDSFAKTLSLSEAILLAVRENPNVQQAQLNYVLQKYAYDLARWKFKPHYFFSATHTTSKNYTVTDAGYVSANESGANLGATLATPYGTQFELTSNNVQTKDFHPSLSFQITQPLLRGFGRPIVEAELYNAIDNKKIGKLTIVHQLQTTVTEVINAYLDVILAKKTLAVDKAALKRSETSVKQTEFFIQAGHKAGVELVAVEAEAANARTRIETDLNNLTQAFYALFAAIGMDPNTQVTLTDLDITDLIKKYPIPSLVDTKKIILENDVQYQIDQMTLNGATQRTLLQAEDNTRWQLNLTANASTGQTTDNDHVSGINSLVNGVNQTNSISLELKIPLDDHSEKNAVASAKIALRQARIALQQEKWNKETSAINAWNDVFSHFRSLNLSKQADTLQTQTWDISFQKYNHGLIDSLELQSAEQQLINSQQNYNATQINYLKALVGLDQMLGQTLKTWKIQVNYGAPI